MEFLSWLQENYITLSVVLIIIIYRDKLIFEPLRGGNGKLQMDEAAKGVIVALLIYTVHTEANRADLSKSVFSDTFYLILLSGVFAIASIKPVMEVMKHKYTKENESEESETTIITQKTKE